MLHFYLDSQLWKFSIEHNRKNGITPHSIIKSVKDNNLFHKQISEKQSKKYSESEYKINFENIEEVELIRELKKEMLKASKELQFEKAAFLRDKIQDIEGNSIII